MALNWAMTDANGKQPVPLPEEKIWLATEHCQMSLEFKDQKTKWEAKGTIFVTNQRVVFLRQPPLPAPADQSEASKHLRSLNVPLTHLVDSRYMMPVFSAPYYEAGVIPVPGGNLPEPPSGGPTCKGSFKVWFNEGGGSAFRDAVEEVRNLAKNAQHGEQLPTYQPPSGAPAQGSAAPSLAATANSSLEERTVGDAPGSGRSSMIGTSSPAPRSVSRASQLSPDDLAAARVAHQQEEAEREATRTAAERREAAPAVDAPHSTQRPDDDGPPPYAMVSPITTFVRQATQEDDEDQVETKARGRAHARWLRMQKAMSKVAQSEEGRDRLLQLFHGLVLLLHHSFSVKKPRSYGIYPIPHIFFFLFPRSVRRKTLKRIHLTAEGMGTLRRILAMLRWFRGVGETVAEQSSKVVASDKGKARAVGLADGKQTISSTHSDPSSSSNRPLQPPRLYSSSSYHISSHTHADNTSNDDDNHDELEKTPRQKRLAEVVHICGSAAEAADVAAFLGGSATIWRIAKGGYVESGQSALRTRQKRGLERTALSFGLVALAIQVYLLYSLRRRGRKAPGRLNRRILLLTDELGDAQVQAPQSPEQGLTRSSGPLLNPQPPPKSSSTTTLVSISHSLTLTESQFQQTRRRLNLLWLEMMTSTFELGFATFEFVLPKMEKQWWEGQVSVLAGGLGMLKVARA